MTFNQEQWIKENDPSGFWQAFHEITQIPRCSKNEMAVRDFMIRLAEEEQLEHKMDEFGNLLIYVPATNPDINKTTVIQGHLDMVCEKNDSTQFDFHTQPIPWIVKGDMMLSEETTLGADNGIAIAAAMVLMRDRSIPHGKLELLFTLEEEIGLFGAAAVPENWLTGSYLLNLDSEEEGKLCIGCAGGVEQLVTVPIEIESIPENATLVYLNIKHAKGGHSGVNINNNRANPMILAGRTLHQLQSGYDFRIISAEGGSRRNALARECSFLVALSEKEQDFQNEIKELYQQIYDIEWKTAEPEMELSLNSQQPETDLQGLTKASTTQILDAILAVPHGVVRMSPDMENLVETSSNFALLQIREKECYFHFLHRSSVDTGMTYCLKKTESVFRSYQAAIEEQGYYPGWKPDPESQLLKKARQAYFQANGKDPEIIAMHAGLECGIIGKKYPEMEMISIGPDIFFPHAPGESVSVSSTKRFWEYLCELLNQI
jgi:dipeptidase D